MKRIKIDAAAYTGDADYKLALEELDLAFPGVPGIPRDVSLIGRLRKLKRPKAPVKYVLKFGLSFVIVAAIIGLLKFVFPVLLLLPVLYFVIRFF